MSGGLWTSGNPSIATVSGTGIVTGISAGTAIISYSLTGCVATAIVTVNASIPAITGTLNICVGQTTTLANTAGGGTWTSGAPATASIGSLSGVVTGLGIGTASITYSLGGGCTATAIVTVSLPPNAGIINGAGRVCPGATITLSDTVSGGSWSTGNTNATITTGGVLTGISSGTTVVTYTVPGAACPATTTRVITINPVPDAGIISGQPFLCTNASISLTESVAGGKWASSNTTIATIDSVTGAAHTIFTGATTITYSVGPDANGCTNDTTFLLTVGPAPFTIAGIVVNVQCNGAGNGGVSLDIAGSAPPFQYQWSNGGGTSAITGLVPGTYTVTVTHPATQCTETRTYSITQPDTLLLTATVTADTCKAGIGSISVDVTGGTTPYTYAWSVASLSGPAPTALPAGTYSLTLTDGNNCSDTLTATVAEAPCTDIIVHDVITPNGDGVNDVWVIERIQFYPKNLAQVFDKWGDMVYEKQGYNSDWHGQSKTGTLLPDGTYYYVLKLNTPNANGGKDFFTGTILIKR